MRSPQLSDSPVALLTCWLSLTFVLMDAATGSNVPTFKSKPTIVKSSEHDTVLLPCYIDNLGANTVKWWKDDLLVWDTSNTTLVSPTNIRMFSSNKTLEVSDVSDADTGEYTCQVVRPDPWGPLNQVHAIEVEFPPIVKPVPSSGEMKVQLNDEAVLGCVATGVPQPVISWTFQGKELQLLSNRATLRFTVTNRAMEGEYECIANNGVGEPTSAFILLKITYPPEVITEKMWIHTSPGLRVDLSCIVYANPDAKVDWYKDGNIVDARPRIIKHRTGEKHSLIIRNVRKHDLGYYTCRASNSIGQGQQAIQLSGVANPAVFKKLPHQSNEDNFTLVWEVDSYSTIYEYSLLFRVHNLYSNSPGEWTKLVIPADSHSPGPIHSQMYTLTGLTGSSVYEASVLSRNSFGWSRPSQIFRFSTKNGEELEEDVKEPDETLDDLDTEEEKNNIQTVVSADFEAAFNTDNKLTQVRAEASYTSSCTSTLGFLLLTILYICT